MSLFLAISLSLLTELFQLGGTPHVIERAENYERIALTDSTTMEVYKGDSIFVVMTVCAPQCSSCARIYNKEWQPLHDVRPTVQSVFPLASIEDRKIVWRDNDTWEY